MKKEYLHLIDQNTSKRYTLSIRLASDGFCFSLCDHLDSNKVLSFPYKIDPVSSELANVKNLVEYIGVISELDFRKVCLVYSNWRSFTVPLEAFEEETAVNMFSSLFNIGVEDMVLYNIDETKKHVYIYSLNKYVKRYIDSVFKEVEYYSSLELFGRYCLSKGYMSDGKSLFAYVCDELLEVCVADKGELVYINTFSCDNDADRFYYIMNIWTTIGLSQTKDVLCVVSDDEKQENSLNEKFKPYIKNCSGFLRKDKSRQYSEHGMIPMCFDTEFLML